MDDATATDGQERTPDNIASPPSGDHHQAGSSPPSAPAPELLYECDTCGKLITHTETRTDPSPDYDQPPDVTEHCPRCGALEPIDLDDPICFCDICGAEYHNTDEADAIDLAIACREADERQQEHKIKHNEINRLMGEEE